MTPAGVLTATARTFKCFLGKIASVFFDGRVVQLRSRRYGFLSTLLHEMCVKPVLLNLLFALSLGQERKENPPPQWRCRSFSKALWVPWLSLFDYSFIHSFSVRNPSVHAPCSWWPFCAALIKKYSFLKIVEWIPWVRLGAPAALSLHCGELSVLVKFHVADPLRDTRVKMGLVVQ